MGLISLFSRDAQESSVEPQFENINPLACRLLHGPTVTSVHNQKFPSVTQVSWTQCGLRKVEYTYWDYEMGNCFGFFFFFFFFFFKHTKNFQCFKEWAVSSVSMFQEHSWLVLHPILLSDSNRVMEARRERMDYRGFRCDIQWARVPSCPDTRGRVVRQGRGEGQPSRWCWSSPWGHCLHVPVGKLSSQQCLWPCSLS